MNAAALTALIKFILAVAPSVEEIIAELQKDFGLFAKAQSIVPDLEKLTTALKTTQTTNNVE